MATIISETKEVRKKLMEIPAAKPYEPTGRDLAILRALPWQGRGNLAMVLGQNQDLDKFIAEDCANGGYCIKAIVNQAYTERPVLRTVKIGNSVPEKMYVTLRCQHNVFYNEYTKRTYLANGSGSPYFNVQVYGVDAKYSLNETGKMKLEGVYLDDLQPDELLYFANDQKVMTVPQDVAEQLILKGHYCGPVMRSDLSPAAESLPSQEISDCYVLTCDRYNPRNVLHTSVKVREKRLKARNSDNIPAERIKDVAMGYEVSMDGVPMYYDNQMGQMLPVSCRQPAESKSVSEHRSVFQGMNESASIRI